MEDNIQNKATSKRLFSWKSLQKFSLIGNKYLLASTLFLVWMLFFDPKDIGTEIGKWGKYRELQASEAELEKKIDDTKAELKQLQNNAQTIERYAREKYLMKKDNEDLFIVLDGKAK